MPNMITPSTMGMCGRRNRKVDGQVSPIAEASTTHRAKYPEAIDDIVLSHLTSKPAYQVFRTPCSPSIAWQKAHI
jgi:hypothetical protein